MTDVKIRKLGFDIIIINSLIKFFFKRAALE
jgi:hypothetical protein